MLGYGARLLRESAADPDTASTPAFGTWEALFVDGLKQFAVGFVYLLGPALVFGLAVAGAVLGGLSGNGGARVLGLLGLLAGFLVDSVAFIVVYCSSHQR